MKTTYLEKRQGKIPNKIPLKYSGKDTFGPEEFKTPDSTTNPLKAILCSDVD